MKNITVRSYMSLANKINEYKRLGYQITYELSGKEYVFRKGIRQVVRITKENM